MRCLAKNLMLIHGAWSGRNCFNYIQTQVESFVDEIIYFRYDSQKEALPSIINRAKKELASETKDLIIVGHSLGGLIALSLIDEKVCVKVITMASPLSGIKLHPMFQSFIYHRAPILKEIGPNSTFIKQLHKKTYDKPIHCLITCRGFNPAVLEPSDGVVTLDSQENWLPQSAISTHVDCNHYEILQSKEAIAAIKQAYK